MKEGDAKGMLGGLSNQSSWYSANGFHYKTMKYQQSCFPCCLHVLLANLNLVPRDDSIEDLWERILSSETQENRTTDRDYRLNRNAPNEREVHICISRQNYLSGLSIRLITPTMLEKKFREEELNEVCQKFSRSRGMVIGIGHAHVVYRLGSDYVLLKPSPESDSTSVVFDNKIEATMIQSTDKEGYALSLQGKKNQDFSIAGNFILILG